VFVSSVWEYLADELLICEVGLVRKTACPSPGRLLKKSLAADRFERGHHPSNHHPEELHESIHATLSDINANAGKPRDMPKPTLRGR
jgi:hypothetical protein